MTDETIVAIYDTPAHARLAAADLEAAGVPVGAISVHADAAGTTASSGTPERRQGFWASLFGGEPDHDTAVYDRSLAGGSTVVTVRTPESHVSRVLEILDSHQPIDIDERASGYGLTRTGGAPIAAPAPVPAPASATGAGTLELSEESLVVGKRLVNRGGTRVRRYVVETPIEQQVTLHDETVTLERRPVTDGRAVTDSFSDKAIEMVASGEEAVVGKTAHVYEEVGLNRQATDRVETVRDTVRREEVEVEALPVAGTTSPLPPKV